MIVRTVAPRPLLTRLPPAAFPGARQGRQQRRRFVITPPQKTFSATRTIAHPPSALFALIADVDSYASFVPFCVASTVTETTPPPDRYPLRANLRVGWGGFDETFTSRLSCGRSDARHGSRELMGGVVEADATENGIFEVLRARWVIDAARGHRTGGAGGSNDATVQDGGQESKVDLEIEYKFANPLYAALSEAVMPTVAGKIMEAFEARAETVLGKPGR
ncbi:hypothetical protein DRE_04457 [Drechslerella stenobrocha 248]|uniref:Coenzyme Q-binding protein COQ10 START domain-containing protein n=1 Tax=Drechslerella stenobrocha 248 TaxID=1043628 RepID=W7HQ50_9PEZI|nr:hypothetical protein DRE_04457 [Drechslerella stenobrocha 248]